MTDNSKKKELFLQTLTKAYNHQEYVRFLQELLNDVQMVAPTRFNKEFSSLSGIIAGHYHIGNYKGSDGKKMALFAVQLQNKGNVENARSSQRAFIKTLLDNSGCDGALAAFFTMEKDANGQERPSDKWRLSLVRMEYGFADGKLSTKLTPAKRYSYLVGKGEPCHTAQERLYGIFVQDNVNPSLAELEEAFSVETVTKQFFNDYKEKYLAVKEYLENTPDFMAEAERCGFTSEQFTKKLMGQIVFLYFIQKKGWLGVSAFPTRLTEKAYKSALFRNAKAHNIVESVYSQPNADGISFINREALFALSDEDAKFLSTLVKGKSWGEGPKNFMRALYESCVKQGRNYFDDYLEPLFYEALNVDRGESGFYARFHCRVPFLNGGLFEQLDNYDWVNSDFHIPNSMFSNADEKDKDEADGILDIFDRYNFTMAEDEPMEREVAIDPEMLGKVFENLLDVKDRKSKGAFYTPREIVHYMCQESLINYLTTNTGIEEADVRKFILYGEYFRDNDCLKTKEVIKNGKKSYTVDKNRDLEMPESIFSFKQGVNRLKELDELLANVKIADPAVGSGAFLLGLLNEIVRARQTLTAYMTIEMSSFERFNFYAYGRKAYDLKVTTIKNCLFACDLEPSATDITKLRLWLSIVIDDELVKQDNSEGMYDAHTKPRPLPNLDCNIICGNSLMDWFEGIKLITESSILNNQAETGMDSFYQAGFDNMLQELIKLQDELYFTKQHETKQEIKKKIHAIYDSIILHQLESNPSAVEKYKKVKDAAQQPFILWQLYFPKVFKEKRGFDVVIGNPPYIQLQKEINATTKEKLGDALSLLGFSTFTKMGDIYCLFYEKGWQLLHSGGVLTYITSNKWMRAGYGEKLRKFFAEQTNPVNLIDFASKKVFESACVDVNIMVCRKESNRRQTQGCLIREDYSADLRGYIEKNAVPLRLTNKDTLAILSPMEDEIQTRINKYGTPLHKLGCNIYRGVLTGFNEAFIIDTETKEEIIDKDCKSVEILQPFLRGRDLQRWGYDYANLWLINTHNGLKSQNISPVDVKNYPAIKEWLDQFLPKLKKRSDKGVTPYNLRNCAYLKDFCLPKIMYAETMRIHRNKPKERFPRFSYTEDYIFLDKTCFMITGQANMRFLLAVMNSALTRYYLQTNIAVLDNGGFLMQKIYIENLPIPKCSNETEEKLAALAAEAEQRYKNEQNADEIEDTIDELVFNLFHITHEEREFIINRQQEQYVQAN